MIDAPVKQDHGRDHDHGEGEPAGEAYAAIIHRQIDCPAPPPHYAATGQGLIIWWDGQTPVGQSWLTVASPIPQVPQISARPDNQPAPNLSVSMVICTRDRPQSLERMLSSIVTQIRRPDEVIVVDNASIGDATRQVCQNAGVRYLREDRAGLDIARNTGWRAANGDLIAYTDDDTELHPGWLDQLVRPFADTGVDAVTGLVLPAVLDTQAQWIFERYWSFGRGFHQTTFGDEFLARYRRDGGHCWRIGAGASMAFRKSLADRIGLFDERLDVGAAGCSGDSEYWHRILASGGTCVYAPRAIVFHHHRADMAGLANQLFHYMRGHSAALLVQFERDRHPGSLYRLLVTLPLHYARYAAGRLLKGPDPRKAMLRHQITGWISGIGFYLRTRLTP